MRQSILATALIKAIRETTRLFSSHRKLWLPFLVTACVEACLLGMIWLAPHPPFSKLFAPPIRYFFGDRMLHYPWHLWFLYYAMKHTQVMASITVGAFMTGVACALVRQWHQGGILSIRDVLVHREVRYVRVCILWAVIWGMARVAGVVVARFIPDPIGRFWVGLGLILLLQSALIYAIPVVIFHRCSWLKAMGYSVKETLRHPVSTILVVVLPSTLLVLFAIVVSPGRATQWMVQISPEFMLVCMLGRLILWTVVDAVVTVSVCHLWWFHRGPSLEPVACSHAKSLSSAVAASSGDLKENAVVA